MSYITYGITLFSNSETKRINYIRISWRETLENSKDPVTLYILLVDFVDVVIYIASQVWNHKALQSVCGWCLKFLRVCITFNQYFNVSNDSDKLYYLDFSI